MKETDWAKLFGIRIKARRRSLRITQKELADAVHCGESSIQQYERGLRIPKENTKEAIAAALGCTTNDLFGYKTESGLAIQIGHGEGLPPDELREWFDKKRKEAAEKQQQEPTPDQNELTPEEQKELDNYKKYLLWKRNQ